MTPWGMTFLPDGRLLVSERPGTVRVLTPGQPLTPPMAGTPAVWAMQDGGLLDIAIHPDYAANGWVYLAYCEPGPAPTSTTKIVRGKIRDGRWEEQQTIYQSPAALYVADNTHFGSRFLFDNAGHLFFTIGDRGTMADAQSLTSPNGKVHRVLADGAVPPDNPFAKTPGALGMIWSMGNRNPQGLAWHPVTGELWSTEHGPRGGDELNVIQQGRNYGWPIVTYGINYDGTPITDKTAAPGLESPITYWTPSAAPSGIAFYTGDRFPAWKNDLFVAMLAGHELRRVTVTGQRSPIRRRSSRGLAGSATSSPALTACSTSRSTIPGGSCDLSRQTDRRSTEHSHTARGRTSATDRRPVALCLRASTTVDNRTVQAVEILGLRPLSSACSRRRPRGVSRAVMSANSSRVDTRMVNSARPSVPAAPAAGCARCWRRGGGGSRRARGTAPRDSCAASPRTRGASP